MAEHYRFFDSTGEDERVYTADEFAEYFRRVLTDGIFNGGTNLKVETDGTNIRTYIRPGYAWLQGYMYKIDTEPLYLQHEYPDPALDRIDRVVIRLDKRLEHRYVRAFILTGKPAASPVPPALTRDENVFELSLAQVRIVKGKSYIEGWQITDERLDNKVCGLVNSLIQADTTTIFNQFQSWYTTKTVDYQWEWADWFAVATSRFEQQWQQWFDSIQGQTPVKSVNGKTGNVVLTAADVGAETPAGAQTKANTAETNAKNYAIDVRKDQTKEIRTEVVSSFPSHANGRIIYHTGEKKFFGSANGKWV
ncbi:phage tail protein [Brevibacillus borstelensis]|uniref:phage tail protein n=1 Tax=Brevibacillus borstelensis TaxID=45462 RepID=UPI0030C4B42F